MIKKHTCRDITVEILLTDSQNDILAITFKNLGTGNRDTIVRRTGGAEA